MSFFFPVKNLGPKQKERKMKGGKTLTRPGHRRHPARLRGPPRRRLFPHRLDGLGPRPDESDPFLLAPARKRRALREEAVPRVDDVDAVGLGARDDPFDVEVGLVLVLWEKGQRVEREE